VEVGLATDTGYPHTGTLDFLGNRVDRGTGTIRARAVLANPGGLFMPGLFARVKLATDAPRETVLVDDQAIGTDQGRRYVLVLGAGDKA
ncbi:efflux RND transporter periplasmic adaptor subunit, partial [Klebsiella pneumoniae]|uniref:efflux RND transporter periplasmic adaptor subunit n=1 Tax=Klebsiella pneumoniae TaxID=573 RepID=UPI002770BF1D|nr:efflux transporter periplasmic adaptor subunit [Klebsiella pneumoniae]